MIYERCYYKELEELFMFIMGYDNMDEDKEELATEHKEGCLKLVQQEEELRKELKEGIEKVHNTAFNIKTNATSDPWKVIIPILLDNISFPNVCWDATQPRGMY